jgi:hypothetical protein
VAQSFNKAQLALTASPDFSTLTARSSESVESTPLTSAHFLANPSCRVAMTTLSHFRIAIALLVCIAGGCRLFPGDTMAKGHSPLQSAGPSPDSVAMEIIWARFPANDPVLGDAAWREIDETQIEPSVRRELLNNGIRAGVIGSIVPAAIDRVLHQRESTADVGQPDQTKKKTELMTEPIVHGHILRARRNQRTDIQASEEYPLMPLLVSGNAELGGRPYQQAKAVYCLRVEPRPDRTALVELTPEIQHGAPRFRFTTGDDGILKQASLNERKVFDQLKLSVRLAPSEMLVLMSLPNSGSQLGHYFHTVDSADGPQQKLILIRLAQVPDSDTFVAQP